MTRLQQLFDEQQQSPWLDNLRRDLIRGGGLATWVERGIRGVTSNPSIFQKAIEGAEAYDEQFASLMGEGRSVDDAYWELVTTDITEALAVLAPVHAASNGLDGYVSVEVSPALARDTEGTIAAARALHQRIAEPNLYVKIPGTAEGVPAIEAMIAEGHSINVTLLFSVPRYDEVIEAYLSGLETFVAGGGDPSTVSSVASFFVSRVDSEVDKRLEAIGGDAAGALAGKAAIANAKQAYALFRERFSGPRWEALAAAGAAVQRPLWASTSTKNAAYSDTRYVDSLIGPDTVNTIPDATLDDFEDHGTVARTVDVGLDEARADLAALADVGVDLDDVAQLLEDEGVAAFSKSFDELLSSLTTKAHDLPHAG
jgi:transaldolase